MTLSVVCLLASLGASPAARGEPAVTTRSSPGTATPTGDLFQARLRYGAAVRSGSEQDLGPGLSYSGVSPNDLAFSGWWWFLLSRHLGLTASVNREAFALYDGDQRVTGGGLLRASVGPTGRVKFGPVRLEAAAGYALAQLPVFGTIARPAFAPATRHAVLLAARGLVDVGPVTVEGRFEYPIALAVSTPGGSSTGLAAAGAVRVNLFRTGALKWGLLAEVSWNQDSLTAADLSSSQSVLRAGGALDLVWQEEANAPRFASVRIRVTAADAPLANSPVTLSAGGVRRELVTDASGLAEAADVEPGAIVASAAAPGFLPGEAGAEVAAGQTAALTLALEKEPPKVGGLMVRVTSKLGGAVVPAAVVEVGGAAKPTDDKGALLVEGLAPGPVGVKVTAPGYTPGEEAASIVAGQTSELEVKLVPEKKRLPATLNGHIRNVRGGKPVAATLEIRELKLKLTADADGRFSQEIPGGTYTVKISAPKFITQTKKVVVRDGDQAIFNVELFPR